MSWKAIGGLAQAKRLQTPGHWPALGCLDLTFRDVLFETLRYMLRFRYDSRAVAALS